MDSFVDPSCLKPGTKIAICGLKGTKTRYMNGVEGIINKYSAKKDRYVVELPNGSMLVKRINLTVVTTTTTTTTTKPPLQVFRNEDEMMERLQTMGVPLEMLTSLTLEQKQAMMLMTQKPEVIERAKNTPGVMASSGELKEEADGLYAWKDAKDHVYLEVKNATPSTICVIGENKLQVTREGEMMLEGDLFQKVDCTKSLYEIRGEKLLVTLVKKKSMRWLMVLR